MVAVQVERTGLAQTGNTATAGSGDAAVDTADRTDISNNRA
ncbi:hypothetical protein [Pseudonocardia xinjiangensis]|nr:hypothetical protein [Pseudonocardia xinjiangensis]